MACTLSAVHLPSPPGGTKTITELNSHFALAPGPNCNKSNPRVDPVLSVASLYYHGCVCQLIGWS